MLEEVIDMGIDCPHTAGPSHDVRSDDEFGIVMLVPVEVLPIPLAIIASADPGSAALDEAESTIELPEAWNVDA